MRRAAFQSNESDRLKYTIIFHGRGRSVIYDRNPLFPVLAGNQPLC